MARFVFRSPIGGAHTRPAGVTVVVPERADDDPYLYPGDVVESDASLDGPLWEPDGYDSSAPEAQQPPPPEPEPLPETNPED